MSKIVLNDVASGANVSVINANFDKIEKELNERVLYRDNVSGEPNTLEQDLDMNGKKLYNLPDPTLPTEPLRLKDLQSFTTPIGSTTALLTSSTAVGKIRSTNVQAALADIDTLFSNREYNPKDYPWLAKFDGVTDDTVAIQACLTDLYNAGGGTMILPRGTAKVSSLTLQFSATKPILIKGQGQGATVIRKITGTTTPVFKFTATSAPQVVHSRLENFSIIGDGTKTHNGVQLEGLAYFYTKGLTVQSCDVCIEILGSLIGKHEDFFWTDSTLGVRTRKLGAVYPNLISFHNGLIGSNRLGVDIGHASNIKFRDVNIDANGQPGAGADAGGMRIRDTCDDETGFSEISLDNVWFEGNLGRNFVCDSAGGIYLNISDCKMTGNAADACTVGTIASFIWKNSEAASPAFSDTLTVSAAFTVLIGGIVYQLADTSTWKTYLGFRTSSTVYDHYTNRLFMEGYLYSQLGFTHKILGGAAAFAEGNHITGFQDRSTLGNTHTFFTTNGNPGNAANACGLRLGANSVTGRSLNSGGTNNAGGTDYAEYEFKRVDCGTFNKGDIVGYDENGKLTDKWSLAKTFGIKSTNPSFVGGDTWADTLNVNLETNEMTEEDKVKYEELRKSVDRIAYSGKVPCNVVAQVQDYVIPVEGPNDSITGIGVKEPTLSQYLISVGQVRNIGEDGRPVVAVKVS